MKNNQYLQNRRALGDRLADLGATVPKKLLVGAILLIALVAFEIFNFDTSEYALSSLLGNVQFLGLQWSTILALAFCSIDFAGLIRIFTPERGMNEPKEVWYLTGAWLLGATMNAILTWWAVSLALLNHQFGNEVLSREQLLLYVPIFVAVLVWLTRILFIGAFSVAGEHIFEFTNAGQVSMPTTAVQPGQNRHPSRPKPRTASPTRTPPRARATRPAPKPQPRADQPTYVEELQYEPIMAQPTQTQSQPVTNPSPPASRVRQRPPRPSSGPRRPAIQGIQARPRNRSH